MHVKLTRERLVEANPIVEDTLDAEEVLALAQCD
jgi:hypothetical protein